MNDFLSLRVSRRGNFGEEWGFELMARVAANYRNKQEPTSLLHKREDTFEPKN